MISDHGQNTVGYTPGSWKGIYVEDGGTGETIAHELGHLFLQDLGHKDNWYNDLMASGQVREANNMMSLDDLVLTQQQVDQARNNVVKNGW
jgi:hypothetical protein